MNKREKVERSVATGFDPRRDRGLALRRHRVSWVRVQ